MPWYRVGTASVANNSTAVTGTATGWLSQAKGGDGITFNAGATWYEIASVNSNTSLTLATAFAQTTVSGGAYAIDRRSPSWTLSGALAEQLAEMIARSTRINTGSGAPSNSLGVDGDFYFRSDVPTLHGPKAGGVWPSGVPWTGGVPVGGTAGQVLEKINATNYNAAWVTPRHAGDNLIINPRMQVNQRGFAGGALAEGVYGWDRWKGGVGGAVVASSNDVITHTSGRLIQVVEKAMWDNWALRPMVFSVTDLSGPLDIAITIGAQTYTTTLAAGSGQRAFAFTTINSNANITIDLWANSGEVTYKWPRLEFGTIATAPQARPLAEEIGLCERYYQVYGGQGGSAAATIAPAFAISSTTILAQLQLRTRLRASPTISFGGTISSDFGVQSNVSQTALLSSLIAQSITVHSCQFNMTPVTGHTSGHGMAFRFLNSSARIFFNVEL
jgi:hypothetical protein